MSPHANPLHASCYADRAIQQSVEILQNEQIAKCTFRTRFGCPEMASAVTPGQFFMVRLADSNDPVLARPFALYDVVHDDANRPWAIDFVYLVGGKMTSRLAEFQPGRRLDVWGPLGNGFQPKHADHLIMVAGGIGQTPFLAVGKEQLGRQSYGTPPRVYPASSKVTFCYGARSADYLAGLAEFESAGMEVRISTDDGSRGHQGFITDVLEQVLDESELTPQVVCCGPEAMMEAVARITSQRNVPCDVSLETPMACGIGICFTCVAKVVDDGGEWDYKRTCVEGPVFDAKRIVWT